jgi:hypothetical protein
MFFFWSEKCFFFSSENCIFSFSEANTIHFATQRNFGWLQANFNIFSAKKKKKKIKRRIAKVLSLSLSSLVKYFLKYYFSKEKKTEWRISYLALFSKNVLFSFLGRKEKMINLFSRLNEQDKVETKYKNVNFFSSKLSFRFKQLLKGENWMRNKVTDK